jgi:HEAT repeat protein
MKLWKRALIGTALATILLSFAFIRRAPDPITEGRALSAWVLDLLSSDYTVRWEAQRVLLKVGEPCVPKVRELLLRRSAFQWPEYLKGLGTFFPFLSVSRMDPALCRARAAEFISLLGAKAVAAAPELVDSLSYPQATRDAERALQRIGDPAVPAIIDGLRSRKAEIRIRSARLLRDSTARGARSTGALIQALRDSQPAVRREAAVSLGKAGTEQEKTVAALLAASVDSAAEVRAACFEAVRSQKRCSPAILARIRTGMEDPIPLVRLEAAKAYWALTHDSDISVRVLNSVLPTQEGWQAAYALAAIGPGAAYAIPALIEVLKREKVPRAFRTPPSSSFALGQIQEAAIPALESVLAHPEPAVRIAAVLAFGFMGEHARGAVPKLTPLLQDPEPEIRQVTAITLATAGAGRELVLPGLADCLHAEDIYVRSTAGALLRQIAPEKEWAIASE